MHTGVHVVPLAALAVQSPAAASVIVGVPTQGAPLHVPNQGLEKKNGQKKANDEFSVWGKITRDGPIPCGRTGGT